MFEPKNYDSVFTRNLIVGLASFLYDVIEIKQVEDGVVKLKRIPMFHSMTGEEQFITDYFLNTDKYCNTLSPKIEGNVTRIPSGIFNISNVGINQQSLGSGYTRVDYQKEFDTEFSQEERDMSARTDFIPLQYDMEVKIKCGSDIERLKIFEAFIKKFWKIKKFYIKYEGFRKLPITISFPDSVNMSKNFVFKYPENDKRPQLVATIQVIAPFPVVDLKTERFSGERIDAFTTIIEPKKPELDDTSTDTDDINEDFKIR